MNRLKRLRVDPLHKLRISLCMQTSTVPGESLEMIMMQCSSGGLVLGTISDILQSQTSGIMPHPAVYGGSISEYSYLGSLEGSLPGCGKAYGLLSVRRQSGQT